MLPLAGGGTLRGASAPAPPDTHSKRARQLTKLTHAGSAWDRATSQTLLRAARGPLPAISLCETYEKASINRFVYIKPTAPINARDQS